MTNRTMKIELTANGKATVANLVDSSTARDFIALPFGIRTAWFDWAALKRDSMHC